MPIFFNSQHLPPSPGAEYVAWIDVMGIQSAMGRLVCSPISRQL